MGAACGGWRQVRACGLGSAWPPGCGLWGKGDRARSPALDRGCVQMRAPPSPAAWAGRAFAPGLYVLARRMGTVTSHGAVARTDGRGWARRQHSTVPPGVRILVPGLAGQEPVSSGLAAPASSQCPARGGSVKARRSSLSLSFLVSLLVQGHVGGQAGGWRPRASGQVRRGAWVSGTWLSPPSPECCLLAGAEAEG